MSSFTYKPNNHYPYKDLCETLRQDIYTKDINRSNINQHFNSIINILKDGIEKDDVKKMMLHIYFADGEDVELSIFDYLFNLMFWQLNTEIDAPINSVHLVFFEAITKKEIKNYIDNIFVDKYRGKIPFLDTNVMIDNIFGKFRDIKVFQPYLANTLNVEDMLDLMNEYQEVYDALHFDISQIPLEDVKDAGMKMTDTLNSYIKKSDHCLRDSIITGECVNPRQFKEVAVNVGSKPDGQGSVFPHPIKNSFMNGGLQTPEEMTVESSVGRIAQILQKNNVGNSGALARQLELNNQDSFLNPDPDYTCDTQNFEEVYIENMTMLNMYNLRYYRFNPKGIDYLLMSKRDVDLVGKTLYFRSPMTCASAARGHGICRKCYGELYFTNLDINVGQIAAEGLSSIYTQILLSAKHLLESLVIKMVWTPAFNDFFIATFNTIGLIEGKNFKGCKLIIDEEIKSEEELDDIEYNNYINSFKVRYPDGTEADIHTQESDNLYLEADLLEYINRNKTKGNLVTTSDDDEYYIELDMSKLADLPSLFRVEIKNNELSATMDHIKKLIDNKSVISEHDRNTILREFITTNIKGNIKLNAVHFEVLLMNQIRAADDIMELPDWTIPNAPYQILTLTKSLSDNRSIGVRLQSSKVQKALLNPLNDFIHHPSISDLYYQVTPQEYLSDDFVSDDYRVEEDDISENVIEPISFDNPKIRVGHRIKKKKIPKNTRFS